MEKYSEIIEIPLYERLYAARNLFICLCIVVKGQLDVDRLRDSFLKLVIEWPRLGATLHRKSKKTWDVSICIPAKPDATSFSFTTQSEATLLIPALPTRSAVSCDTLYTTHIDHFKTRNRPENCLDILNDPTAPTTYIHVTSFRDATCVGITVPHIMYDALGLCEIVKEWCAVMRGNEITRKVITSNPLEDVTGVPYPKSKSELSQLVQRRSSTLARFSRREWYSFLAKFIADLIKHPKEKTRLVFVPMKYIEKIRKGAQKKGHWVSENDVVTASLFKLSLYRHKKKERSYMTLSFTANMRGEIPTLAKGIKEVFLGNANYPMTVSPRRINQYRNDSVEDVAISIRQSILQQRDYSQIQIAATITCEATRNNEYVQYHKDGGLSFYITSWSRGQMFDFDFRGAVRNIEEKVNGDVTEVNEKDGMKEKRDVEPGEVLHVDGTSGLTHVPKRGWCVVFGKVEHGANAGYWAEFTAPVYVWPKVAREIATWWD